MEHAHDLVIRAGLVADGTGAEPMEADVGVKDGAISAIGRIRERGTDELDARGKLVTPGFVDVHTHYDGQATWDERMQPSSWHGVTTVVMGNCGVGFAPCKPGDHERLIKLMEGVEDIPFPVLAEGLPWNWESFPDYLDALQSRHFDIDIGTQLPHAALRVYVMGQRGADREPATEADIETMAAIAQRAVEAGALGFTTSRTLNHRTSDGQPTPTLTAGEDELTRIAMGLAPAGDGRGPRLSRLPPPPDGLAPRPPAPRAATRPRFLLPALHPRDAGTPSRRTATACRPRSAPPASRSSPPRTRRPGRARSSWASPSSGRPPSAAGPRTRRAAAAPSRARPGPGRGGAARPRRR